jgi:RNA polymerase sigma factor (sigma-70 family)
LYTDIYPKIKVYVVTNSGSTDDALDIFQDALVILCKQIRLGKYDTNYQVSGFLFAVSRNLWINKAKRNGRIVSMPENYEFGENDDFSELIITKEKENTLKEITLKLGKKCFELLKSAIFHQETSDEIIKKMGFSTANALKTQKYKCKQKLFKLIEDNPKYREAVD